MIGFFYLQTKLIYKWRYCINSAQSYLAAIILLLFFFQLRQDSDFTNITG